MENLTGGKNEKKMSEDKNGEPSTQNIEKYIADSLLPFLVVQEFVEKFDIWYIT